MAEERFLVTGGTGCIGSWVVRNLVKQSVPVVVLTVDDHFERLQLILSEEEFDRIEIVHGDITDLNSLVGIAKSRQVNKVIHLAGLQLPFCKANPSLGASVDVVGTINVFEMAKRMGMGRVVFASSAAVYGPKTHYPESLLPEDAGFFPTSHYGVYKIANEQNAKVYWQDDALSSIGLRPHTVYGPGRDQGMTSKPTLAMMAAAAKRKYHINFGGSYQFQFADDVARVFIAAVRVPFQGAKVYNVGGAASSVAEIVRHLEQIDPQIHGMITFDEKPLTLPEAFDNHSLIQVLGQYDETPLNEGIAKTYSCYRDGIQRGLIKEEYLNRVLV